MDNFETAPEGLRAKADELDAEAQVLRKKAESCESKARFLRNKARYRGWEKAVTDWRAPEKPCEIESSPENKRGKESLADIRRKWAEELARLDAPTTACTVLQRQPFEIEMSIGPCKSWPDACSGCDYPKSSAASVASFDRK